MQGLLTECHAGKCEEARSRLAVGIGVSATTTSRPPGMKRIKTSCRRVGTVQVDAGPKGAVVLFDNRRRDPYFFAVVDVGIPIM
jgi:hypothetical protein